MTLTDSPGKGKPQGLSTVDQHTLTYLQKKDLYGVDPRRLFDLDFHAVLRMLKSKGKHMDVNKYIIIGKFMQRLMSNSMLDLVEKTHLH